MKHDEELEFILTEAIERGDITEQEARDAYFESTR
jgi:hypothetical protein